MPTAEQLFENTIEADVSIDDLATMWRDLDAEYRQVREMRARLASAIQDRTIGQDGKTRRLRGDKYRIKVVLPGTSWDQATMKALWNDQYLLATKYLRIERLAPQKVEVNKLQNESGGPGFMQFRAALLSAETESTANPYITLEEVPDGEKSDPF